MYRNTYIKIDCNKLMNNVKNIIKNNSSYEYYFGVVKNNAYHHGIYCIKYLIEAGINYLVVSSLEEAVRVRKMNNSIPILCLEPINKEYIIDAVVNNISLTISSFDSLNDLIECDIKDTLKIHLKVDSGMNRIGFKSASELQEAYNKLCRMKHVEVEGVYTHFACDSSKQKMFEKEVEKFKEIVSSIPLEKIPIVHVDRSGTLFSHNKFEFVNGVRLGECIYGPFVNNHHKAKKTVSDDSYLKYPMEMYSEVIEVRKVLKGEYVGYNSLYKVRCDGLIATICCGYADGVTKDFEFVFINNKKFKIVAECMDMIMVMVDDSVHVGDKVEIIGSNQSISDISKRLGIIKHKVFNLPTFRVPIVYLYNKKTYEVSYDY